MPRAKLSKVSVSRRNAIPLVFTWPSLVAKLYKACDMALGVRGTCNDFEGSLGTFPVPYDLVDTCYCAALGLESYVLLFVVGVIVLMEPAYFIDR
jgi:hypothetical protein